MDKQDYDRGLDTGDDLERLRRFAGEQGRSETGVAAALGAGMVGSQRQATDEEVLQKLEAEIRHKETELVRRAVEIDKLREERAWREANLAINRPPDFVQAQTPAAGHTRRNPVNETPPKPADTRSYIRYSPTSGIPLDSVLPGTVDPGQIYRDGEPEWAAENREPEVEPCKYKPVDPGQIDRSGLKYVVEDSPATQAAMRDWSKEGAEVWNRLSRAEDRAHYLTRHHTPNADQISRIKAVRNGAADFLRTIQTVNGQQLATTIEFAQAELCVREAMMWANAGIVLEGE